MKNGLRTNSLCRRKVLPLAECVRSVLQLCVHCLNRRVADDKWIKPVHPVATQFHSPRMSSLEYRACRALPAGPAGRFRSVVLIGLAMLGCVLFAGRSLAANLADQFADREILMETSGSINGSNINATLETGEPQHAGKPGGSSVWISWMAPTNGIVTFRTSGSSFDTLLAAYYFREGDDPTLDKLREAAGNDDDPGAEPASYIQFAAKAGRRYEIAIDGYRGATGAVVLAWSFVDINTQPPIVVSVPGDRAVRLGDPVTLTVNFETSPDARLQWRFNGDSFGEEGPTLFIPSLQLTNVGRYSLRVRIGDNRFETTPVEIQVNSEGQTNALARDKFLDALDSRLTPDDHGSGGDGAVATGPLIVAAAGQLFGANSGLSRGFNGTQIFNTTYATPDPNEPQHCGVTGGASYWFAYEAPTNGTLHVDTIGSGYDTLLAAYGVQPPATGYDSLVLLACDNDAVALLGESRIQLPVTAGQQYLVVLDGVAGAKGIAHLNYRLETTPPPDSIKPVVSVTSLPRSLTVVTNARLQLAGLASDNVGVSNVSVQTAAGETILASGTNSWSAALDLMAGTNVLVVTAVDAAGNISPQIVRTVVFLFRSPLTITVLGAGTVSGAANEQWLDVGRNYSLIAKPARGYVFREWSGGAASTGERLTFTMQSNLVLLAKFVANPFLPAAGGFTGCFHDTNAVALESSGLATVTLRSSGAFSGTIRQAQRRLSFAGRFDLDGLAAIEIPRKGTNALTLDLTLDLIGGRSITCRISDGRWNVGFATDKAVFHSRSNPATNYAGRYTVLLPGAEDSALAPFGDGCASVSISLSGILTVAGALADGTAFAQRGPLSREGRFALFEAIYRGRGVLVGQMTCRPVPDTGSDIDGIAHWLRLAGPKPSNHTNGFLLASAMKGSAFVRPTTSTVLGIQEANVIFSFGNGNEPVTNSVSFGAGVRITNNGPGAMTLSISTRTGRFRGRMALDGTMRKTAFRGAVLQRQQVGGGYFHHSNSICRVYLGP